MIAIVTCTCGGAENMARTVLKNGGHPNWLNEPVAQGKSQTKYVLDALRSRYKDDPAFQALEQFTSKAGKYIVVIGYDKNVFKWTDVARGKLKDRIDGEIIVKEFA